MRYAEAWERKIQFNTPIETVRDVAARIRTNPMVTVAVRSDGSVEGVTFVLSSGSAEVDEAIRNIVTSHEHYQAFPPALARDVDVIEIRRTWFFDAAVRFY
ncbi:MAG: TonB C-terminal domain-containing protein [Burkholderiaceae bacterium]